MKLLIQRVCVLTILKNFLSFWLCWVFVVVRGLSLVVVNRVYPPAVVCWFLIAVASLVLEHRLSCSVARGMFLDQGLNPRPLRWQADSCPWHHQGSPVVCFVTMKPEFCKPHFCFASNSMLASANGDAKERLEGQWRIKDLDSFLFCSLFCQHHASNDSSL